MKETLSFVLNSTSSARCRSIIRAGLDGDGLGLVDVSIYTLGIWTVKQGREEEFILAWRDLATKTQSDFPGSSATLLRDREVPNRFISSGPWKSLEQIEAWRASPTFSDGVGRIRGLLDSFEPHTMDEAAVIG